MFVEVEIIYNYLSFLLQIHICFRGVSFESNILKIMFFFWFFYLFLCGWNRLWGGKKKESKEILRLDCIDLQEIMQTKIIKKVFQRKIIEYIK